MVAIEAGTSDPVMMAAREGTHALSKLPEVPKPDDCVFPCCEDLVWHIGIVIHITSTKEVRAVFL